MKKRIYLLILSLNLLAVMHACQPSTREKAISAVQSLSDFQGVVQTIDMGSGGGVATWAIINDANPSLINPSTNTEVWHKEVTDIVIYRTKSGGLRVATINSNPSPKITGLSAEFTLK